MTLSAHPNEPCARRPDRPKLRRWRRANDHSVETAAVQLGVSAVQIRRYELPFDDTKRQIPRQEVLERIHAWTRGEVTPADFYPTRLREAAVAE